jgi:DNA-binding NarL/FixJ family response regulator
MPTMNRECEGVSVLTTRERAVANAICRGLRNKEIAQELDIAVPTVRNHLSAVMAKLGVNTRTQVAIRFAPHASEPEEIA